MGLRHKSIRLRVLLLILVPLLSLVGVYAYATTQTARQAIDLAHAGQVANVSVSPTSALITAVAAERSAAMLYLAVPTPEGLAALTKAEGATNKAVKTFQGASMSGPVAAGASELDKVDTRLLIKAAGQLAGLRTSVTARGLTLMDALKQYSAITDLGNTVIQQEIQKANIAVPIVTTAEQQTYFYESVEIALQESDLYVSSVISGKFTPAARAQFARLVGTRRYLVETSIPQLDAASHALYVKYVTPRLSQGLEQVENQVLSRQPPRGLPPVAPAVWGKGVTPYAMAAGKMLKAGTTAIVTQVRSNAESTLLTLILSAGLGLAAIIFSIIFSILVGRGLISQLKGLRLSALELANDRLPSVIRRLRDGENVDVAAETPALEAGTAEAPRTSDEIDQVQEAFNIVQRTAIEAAVDEANLRRGISDVFRNLARRSQVLLHRQLRLLDGMERRASEPEELEDLFRIDHLTTRMRRHAEGLIILSGEPAGRTWRHPVPLMDVLRAAVAEVEDYTRIRVEARTRAALSGTAVADVIHLIAELAENATVFSPPNTPVKISGDIVGRGFAVEIEDRGLGITEERLAEINKNLADPPAFDLSGSDRLGLFIAGRLARRHDIKITLRPSVYGGTSAIVIIPMTLVVDEDNYEHVPAIGTDGRGLPLNGRHAALADAAPADAAPAVGNGASPAGPALGQGASPSGTANLPWSIEASPSGQAPADPSYWNSPLAAPTAASPAAPPLAPSEPPPLPSVPSLPTIGVQSRLAAAGNGPVSPEADWAELVTGPQPAVTEPAPFRASSSPSSPFGADSFGGGSFGGGSFGAGSFGAGSFGGTDGLDARASAPPPAPAPAEPDPANFGLPTRVRQASLAPQLHEPTRPDVAPGRSPGLPSPEAARNTMAALQRGWELGRSAADGPSAPDAGVPPAADND
ncbi:MAG TPA: nitrate- and nitrite sensing domain-containing protein [Streptosporangiaceae bacterium]|nr:nitrate- and nitrite sensing domain-containing protein [Streptosporangiaceae bacterium]